MVPHAFMGPPLSWLGTTSSATFACLTTAAAPVLLSTSHWPRVLMAAQPPRSRGGGSSGSNNTHRGVRKGSRPPTTGRPSSTGGGKSFSMSESRLTRSSNRGALYYALYKPFNVLCQFSSEGDKKTLKDIMKDVPTDVYPVGRLDYDSEGLLLLSNDASLNAALLSPSNEHAKEYWCCVEGDVTDEALKSLSKGVDLSIRGKRVRTAPARAGHLRDPQVPERDPPIRYRANIPTSWLRLEITEGKNRQVRKMTAAVGFPTLRLIRWRINGLTLDSAGLLQPGQVRQLSEDEIRDMVLRRPTP